MSVGVPPVEELLPHSGSMVLLDAVVDHGAEWTACSARVDANELFRGPDGRVPCWVGVEYMAQCIAVDGALRAREAGARLPIGLFLGSRELRFNARYFEPGQQLEVSARHITGDASLAAFQCEIRDRESRELLADGRLSVYVPDDLATLTSEPSRGR